MVPPLIPRGLSLAALHNFFEFCKAECLKTFRLFANFRNFVGRASYLGTFSGLDDDVDWEMLVVNMGLLEAVNGLNLKLSATNENECRPYHG